MEKVGKLKSIFFQDMSAEEWNRNCARIPASTFRHTYEFIDYLAKVCPTADNRSSIIFDERGELVAVCVLFFEPRLSDVTKGSTLSLSGGPVPAPAIRENMGSSRRRRDFAAVFDVIHALCREFNTCRSAFFLHAVSAFANEKRDNATGLFELLSAGYHPTCFNNIHIDLSRPEEELLNDMSKFHRKHIRQSVSEGQRVRIVDKSCDTSELEIEFAAYQDAHTAASGRMTRSQSSFDSMRDVIAKGMGALFVNTLGETPISYLFCASLGRVAHGWSQANVEAYTREHSPRHLLEWEAIRYYKRLGLSFYEVGQRFLQGQVGVNVSDKQLSIATFKERFGGVWFPEIHFEKFFDQNAFSETWASRVDDACQNSFREQADVPSTADSSE